MHIAVLSDTHAPKYWKSSPPAVAARLAGVDAILHAGDVCTASVLEELSEWAPVHAVVGNNDGPDVAAWGAVPTLQFDLDGVSIAMIHDSGPAHGRNERLARAFPDADLIVFGHSHIPWNEVHGGKRVFNPGSPTDKRRQPSGTIGEIRVEDGRVVSTEIVAVT